MKSYYSARQISKILEDALASLLLDQAYLSFGKIENFLMKFVSNLV
jgi:hypothetical protein